MTVAIADGAGIVAAGRTLPLPFALELVGRDARSCIVTRVLRLLPGRRLVALAESGGVPVVVKAFVGAKADRDCEIELDGLRAFTAAGIATPSLVARCTLADDATPVLLLEYIDGRSPDDGRNDIACARVGLLALVDVLARLHAQGVRQIDPHLGNFLLLCDKVVALDGGAARSPRRLTDAARLHDLALLHAQFLPAVDDTCASTLARYRHTLPLACEESRLRRSIGRDRERRLADYLAKRRRDCSEFRVGRVGGRDVVALRAHCETALDRLLDHPDAAIAQGSALKQGNTATVARFECGGRSIVVKRYNVKGMLDRLRHALRPSRAERSFANALTLQFFGVPTPQPLAVVVERRFGLRARTWFIALHVDGISVDRFAVADLGAGATRDALTTTFSRLLAARVVHRDLKATNLIVGAGGAFVLDLDALNRPHTVAGWRRGFRRDRARFLRNFEHDRDLAAAFRSLIDAISPSS